MPLLANQYQLNIAGSGSITINWGDGSSETVTVTGVAQAFVHTYATVNRFLIEITGPGTVTSLEALGTNKTRLEEIQSFGSLGLTSFNHSLSEVGSSSSLNQSFLVDVPATIPSSLVELPGLFSYTNNPAVYKTSSWDWSQLVNVSEFFKEAKNFDFTLRNITLPNLRHFNGFAERSENATFYFDAVRFTHNTLNVYGAFQYAKNVELNLLRTEFSATAVNNFAANANGLTLNWTQLSFPRATSLDYFVYSSRNVKAIINGLSVPMAVTADNAFNLGGSVYNPSNDVGFGGKLLLSNFDAPSMLTMMGSFAGWTNAELVLDLPNFRTLEAMTGFLSFANNSRITVNDLVLRDLNAGSLELATYGHGNVFTFNNLEFANTRLVSNLFDTNKNCTFNFNQLVISGSGGVNLAFAGSEALIINAPNVQVAAGVSLYSFLGNITKASKVTANNWNFLGAADVSNILSGFGLSSTVEANNWTFAGLATIKHVFSHNYPYLTTYTGERAGGPTIVANNWTFNAGAVTTTDWIVSSESGLFRSTENSKITCMGWTFNGPSKVALGRGLLSSQIDMRGWTFNGDVDLLRFASDVGEGNLSPMTINLSNWTFNPLNTNTADFAFANFAKRKSALFGDKENVPVTLIGLGTWTAGAFDSHTNLTDNVGVDVIGLDLSSFS